MKTLALLSIWLALPLLAEAPTPTMLTLEENQKLMQFYIQLQSAELAVYKAQEAFNTGMAELKKAHGANDCQWNLQPQWVCGK
jgi:hypothetical protein